MTRNDTRAFLATEPGFMDRVLTLAAQIAIGGGIVVAVIEIAGWMIG